MSPSIRLLEPGEACQDHEPGLGRDWSKRPWRPEPRPGWHDLLALTKRKQAVLEGDLHPFMAHLQYFKDVLALPRLHHAAVVS